MTTDSFRGNSDFKERPDRGERFDRGAGERFDRFDRGGERGGDRGERGERGGRGRADGDKDRKVFARKKSCWYCAKKGGPDWKDPASYLWLVNEFGKISPARVSGICSKHQRSATRSIKRGRSIGLVSVVSNHSVK